MKKYSCEFGLNVYCSYKTIVPIEYLSKVKDNRDYHLYGILSIPIVNIKESSIIATETGLNLELIRINNGLEEIIKINNFTEIPNLDYKKAKICIKYPYTQIDIKFDTSYLNEVLNKYKDLSEEQKKHIIKTLNSTREAQYFLNDEISRSTQRLPMEVLYIGQAFGINGKRTAIDRLKSHETLQKILTDCHCKRPDRRLFILLLEMTPVLSSVFDGITKKYTCNENESKKHLKDVIRNKLKENQIINITEAAIINYFKPEYNTNFVNNFPSDKHTGYKQYFDLDYNCITIELDMEFNHIPDVVLYSQKNRLNPYEYISYNIFNDPNRSNMYEIFKNKENKNI